MAPKGRRALRSDTAVYTGVVRLEPIDGWLLAPGNQRRDRGKALGEQFPEGLVRELRRSEDVGYPLAVGEDIDGRDGPLLGTGDQLLNTAPLVDDEAEALDDGAAQALRPPWLLPVVVKVIPEQVHRGRSVAAGNQRRHEREPVREELPELAVDEVRRPEDVGDVDVLMQGVEGRDAPALRAGDQLLDTAPPHRRRG